jgi:hypothetical protein
MTSGGSERLRQVDRGDILIAIIFERLRHAGVRLVTVAEGEIDE